MQPVLAIVGPTGSGKSDLGLSIAQRFGGEIISCDSVQVYSGLNIGSAKTPPPERRAIPHHLLDVVDPAEDLTAGAYARLARTALAEIAGRGALPVIVGGTDSTCARFWRDCPQRRSVMKPCAGACRLSRAPNRSSSTGSSAATIQPLRPASTLTIIRS